MSEEKEFWEKRLMEFEKTIIYKIDSLEKKVSEMKEWENYLSKGGLLEQIMEQIVELKKDVNCLEESYTHSMDKIIESLENLLRRIRKLEKLDSKSGGEKLVEGVSNGENGSPQQPDSKLPEPMNCSNCKHNFFEYDDICFKCNTGYSEWEPKEKTEPEKNDFEVWGVPGYDDCNMKIPVKYADVIRINLNYIKEKQSKELIEEILNDLDNFERICVGNIGPYWQNRLNELQKKWQGRVK